ncbi:Hypothetical protein PHPALM_8760 [Phytophthora palmivora]|uniref:Uncharacterized protein n=1 Tax=Phytophthora palmivora TaxID=4796 RepID=A0A2P4Y924_9STRA|nr:Hypothetical protein PHPALM_8760 [Phytophthora palmivora]
MYQTMRGWWSISIKNHREAVSKDRIKVPKSLRNPIFTNVVKIIHSYQKKTHKRGCAVSGTRRRLSAFERSTATPSRQCVLNQKSGPDRQYSLQLLKTFSHLIRCCCSSKIQQS